MCLTEENLISRLSIHDYEITSRKTPIYNALAWAVGGEEEQERWWSPRKYWPKGVAKEETLEAYTAIFQLHSYTICEGRNETLEPGFEKVAIYCKTYRKLQIATHVARQLEDGRWTSKLGKAQDIVHTTLACLEGENGYGTVHRILKRARTWRD